MIPSTPITQEEAAWLARAAPGTDLAAVTAILADACAHPGRGLDRPAPAATASVAAARITYRYELGDLTRKPGDPS